MRAGDNTLAGTGETPLDGEAAARMVHRDRRGQIDAKVSVATDRSKCGWPGSTGPAGGASRGSAVPVESRRYQRKDGGLTAMR